MLANGILLGYRTPGSTGPFTDLEGLKTVPDIGEQPEMVENTPIRARTKRYEPGVGDAGSMEYTFVYDGNTPDSTYRKLRPASTSRTKQEFQEIWPDGTKFQYEAIPTVSFVRGGGINAVVDLKVTMALQSDIEVIDPDEETNEETETGEESGN